MLFIPFITYSYIVIGAYTNTMNRHFVPRKYQSKENRHQKNNRPQNTRNQPEPKIFSVLNLFPKNSDIIDSLHVNAYRKLNSDELIEMAEKLTEKLGKGIFVAPYIYSGYYNVYTLGVGVAWGVFCQAVFDVLKEMR